MFALLFKNLAVSAVPFFISSPFSLLAVVTNCVQLTLKVAAQCGCFRAASTNCAHLADLKLQCPFPRCSRQPGFCQNADDLLSFFTLSVHRAAKEMQSSRVPVALNSVFCFVHRSLFFLLYICGIIIRGLRRLRVTFFFFFFPNNLFRAANEMWTVMLSAARSEWLFTVLWAKLLEVLLLHCTGLLHWKHLAVPLQRAHNFLLEPYDFGERKLFKVSGRECSTKLPSDLSVPSWTVQRLITPKGSPSRSCHRIVWIKKCS